MKGGAAPLRDRMIRRDYTALIAITLFLVAFAQLALHRIIPIHLDFVKAPLSDLGRHFMFAWMGLALLGGILIPLLVLIRGRRCPDVRAVLGPYLTVLLVQIATEASLRRVFFSSLVVVIGTIYTSYRLIDLGRHWRRLHRIDRPPQGSLRWVMSVLFVFWSVNLFGVLLGLQIHRLW